MKLPFCLELELFVLYLVSGRVVGGGVPRGLLGSIGKPRCPSSTLLLFFLFSISTSDSPVMLNLGLAGDLVGLTVRRNPCRVVTGFLVD